MIFCLNTSGEELPDVSFFKRFITLSYQYSSTSYVLLKNYFINTIFSSIAPEIDWHAAISGRPCDLCANQVNFSYALRKSTIG